MIQYRKYSLREWRKQKNNKRFIMNIDKKFFKDTFEYEISIGIKSMITRENMEHVEDVKEVICYYLHKNKVDFSLKVINGGYTYNDDKFDVEKTIVLTFIGGDYDFVKKIGTNLKMILEQETILITRRKIGVAYL